MKLNTKKVLLGISMAVVFGMFLMPVLPALATTTAKGFDMGLEYGKATGLGNQDVRSTIGSVINVALGLLGIVAVVIILIGGFEWMTAGGNDEKTGEAKKRILAGVIGIAIIMSAWALANFILNQLYKATTGDEYTYEQTS